MKKLFISQPMKGKTDEEILKEREKAIAKAQANTLSHYIVNALQDRRDRKNKEDDN